jgi:hypothetical protein
VVEYLILGTIEKSLFEAISKIVDHAQEQGVSRSAVALNRTQGYGGTSEKGEHTC